MATYGDPSCIHHSRRILTRIQTNVHKHTRVQIQFYRCAKSDVSLFSWTRFASNKLLIYINGIGSTFEIKVRDDHVCHDLGTVLNSRSERHQSSFSNHSSRIFPFFFFFFFFLHELETRTDVESFRLQLRWMCIRTNCLSSVYVRIDRSRWLRILTTGFVSPWRVSRETGMDCDWFLDDQVSAKWGMKTRGRIFCFKRRYRYSILFCYTFRWTVTVTAANSTRNSNSDSLKSWL